jgi:hypothetical protein
VRAPCLSERHRWAKLRKKAGFIPLRLHAEESLKVLPALRSG